MPASASHRVSLRDSLWQYCRKGIGREGVWRTLHRLSAEIYAFLRESTPSRRRQRYGDVDYDWDYRVDTTSATLSWRDRLLGHLHSPYQATEPALFHEMLGNLKIDFREFTFIDLGSGKGRALLMAADYPFHRILGVELLPALHRVAQENILRYQSDSQKCFVVDALCGDARDFEFPPEPIVLYLFNPLPGAGLERMISNLARSLRERSRPVFVLYHNPLLESVLAADPHFRKAGGTHQYSIFSNTRPAERV